MLIIIPLFLLVNIKVIFAKFISKLRAPKVAEQYKHIGGNSPQNEHTEKQRVLLEQLLKNADLNVDVLIAMRYWNPLTAETVKRVEQNGANLVIIEKDEKYIEKYPHLKVTTDPSLLSECNKVLCTSTTVFNNTIDDIISKCSPDVFISIIGPTAGYFPDPLFKRGVDVVGGTLVKDGKLFMELISSKERWGPATRKFCFTRKEYAGLPI